MTSTVATVITTIQIKHESEMFSLREMIEKSLLLRDSILTTPSPNPNAFAKMSTPLDNLTKTAKRWNQANLGYFDLYLDKAHEEGEIVSIRKDVYYKNMVLFVQHL